MVVFFHKIRDMVNRPWAEKYATTMGIIDTMLLKYHPRQQMIGWSGGKDSTAVMWLIRKECEDFGIDFNSIVIMSPSLTQQPTGAIEHPETHEFCRLLKDQWNLTLCETYSPINFWDWVAANGLPRVRGKRTAVKTGKVAANCCYALKILPMVQEIRKHGTRVLYLGTTAPESRQRQMKAISLGHTYFVKKWKTMQCLPILYWTEEEVWKFHREENIPYNKIYDKGSTRCGCASCTAYKTWESDMSRLSPEIYARISLMKEEKYLEKL